MTQRAVTDATCRAAHAAGRSAALAGEHVRACPYDPTLERVLTACFCRGYVAGRDAARGRPEAPGNWLEEPPATDVAGSASRRP